MKRIYLYLLAAAFASCGESVNGKTPTITNPDTLEMTTLEMPGGDVVQVPVRKDSLTRYNDVNVKKNCFIVISKKELRLYVYEKRGNDTVKIAHYPVCLSKNLGNKQKVGDMKTPESPKGKPFSITQIQNASTWTHDFHDGRGSIKAYGHWFLRLKTPGHSGIGIHGSTNNESSVPGRASEGCIRLLDKDIIDLHDKYAFQGMNVIIKAENEGNLSFEK